MKLRKELWFGFSLMAIVIVAVLAFMPWANLLDGHLSREDLGHLGLLMLALIVVAIMLGFPTAFTLMGMGVFFAWLAYRNVDPALAGQQVFDAMVHRTLKLKGANYTSLGAITSCVCVTKATSFPVSLRMVRRSLRTASFATTLSGVTSVNSIPIRSGSRPLTRSWMEAAGFTVSVFLFVQWIAWKPQASAPCAQ